MKYIFVIIILIFFALPLIAGDNVYVPRDYSHIQSAIDNSPQEAIIHISDGIYNENIVIESKKVSLIGSGRVIIDAGGKGSCLVSKHSHVNISNITFTSATNSAIIMQDSQIFCNSITVTNSHGIRGAGILLSRTEGDIINSTISNNTITSPLPATNETIIGGAGIFCQTSPVNITNCLIENNEIAINSSSVPATHIFNYYTGGAGVYLLDSDSIIQQTSIRSNTLSIVASGITYTHHSGIYAGGAGLFIKNSNPSIYACTISSNLLDFSFTNNIIDTFSGLIWYYMEGAGVYAKDANPIIANSEISYNQLISERINVTSNYPEMPTQRVYTYGCGLFFENELAVLTNVNIHHNTGTHTENLNNSYANQNYGGGLATIGSQVIINYSQIHHNSRNEYCYGGGVFLDANGIVNINRSTIYNNSCYNGAAVASFNQLNIFSSTLDGNINGNSSRNRGAIYSSKELVITNSIISNNVGAAGVFHTSTTHIPNISYTCTFNNDDGAYGGCGETIGVISGTNYNSTPCDDYDNIQASAVFEDDSSHDYRLTATSACINAGFSDGQRIDIGAFPYISPVLVAVSNVSANIEGSTCTISWDAVPTVTNYHVYASTDYNATFPMAWQKIANNISQTSYQYTLDADNEMYFIVCYTPNY